VKQRRIRFLFLADMQLGAYASVSGLDQTALAQLAERDIFVDAVPRVTGFDWDADRYRRAITMANSIRPDFVVMGGDMVDDNDSPEQLDAVFRIAGDLDEEIPLYWVPGNHDIATNTVVPTRRSIDKYRDSFGRDYYAFDFGANRFIVLNTVVLDHPEEVPCELGEQMEFLEFELSRTAPGRSVVFGHHPLFLRTPEEEDSYWNLPLERRARLLELIHRHRVPVAFAGHWHRNSIAFDGEFQMVTTGPVGVPMGPDPSGLRVVDLDGQSIEHQYRPLTGPTG
jgi:3',5'-cyclic AMP phosphodiesterase CpdA